MKITISDSTKKESKKMFVLGQFVFIGIRMIEPSISFSLYICFNVLSVVVVFLYALADVIVEKFLK